MKKLTSKQYKKIILDILKYIDKLCRDNNINYSLIGGSLIGSVREGGIIPWDDDIDIILMQDEYEKLIDVIEKDNNPRYKIYRNKDFLRPFTKVVDTTVNVEETDFKSKNYYAFVDVFNYRYVSNYAIVRTIVYSMQYYYLVMLSVATNTKVYSGWKILLAWWARRKNGSFWLDRYNRVLKNSSRKKSNYILSNWPQYGCKREIQKASNFTEFINSKFEDTEMLITKNYDGILKTSFGNYMVRPSKEHQVFHHIKAYVK